MKSIKMTVVGAAAAALLLGVACDSDSTTYLKRHDDRGIRHEDMVPGTAGTGGSGMDSSAVAPSTPAPSSAAINDTEAIPNTQAQDTVIHQDTLAQDSMAKDSNIKSSTSSTKSSISRRDSNIHRDSNAASSSKSSHVQTGSTELDHGQRSDLSTSTMDDNNLGMGGAGNTPSTETMTPSTDNTMVPSTSDTTAETTYSYSDNQATAADSQDSASSLSATPVQKHWRLNGSLDNETGSRTNATGSNISTNTNPTEPRNNAKNQVPRR